MRLETIDLANLHLLKDQKVYVVACWTAKVLGRATVNVAHCYLGYEDEVIVWLDPPYDARLEVRLKT